VRAHWTKYTEGARLAVPALEGFHTVIAASILGSFQIVIFTVVVYDDGKVKNGHAVLRSRAVMLK
jgi:hypothetical protein